MRVMFGRGLLLAALALFAGESAAQTPTTYQLTDSANVVHQTRAFTCSAGVMCIAHVLIDSSANPIGVAANPLFVAPGTGQTFPVSAASLPLPAGAATSALQSTINTTLGSPMQNSGGSVGISGTLPAFAATPTFNCGTGCSGSNASVGLTGSAVPTSAGYMGMVVGGNLTGVPGTANGVKVDGSAVTQPVSIGASSAVIGKVGVDQTTPGTTNRVQDTATQVWKPGTLQAAYGSSGFSTEVNSVINGNAILAASPLNNSSALDQYLDISISLGSITTGAGAPYIGFYLCPLNQDGTTYCDGRFGTSAAGPPASQYFVGPVPCAPSFTGVITGTVRGVLLPPGQFKLLLYNQAGATLASSANTISVKSYNSGLN